MTRSSASGVVWNSMDVHVVPAGTIVEDPNGKADPIIVDDTTVACVGRKLYCTASTEAKLAAKIAEKAQPYFDRLAL